jgi:hypothetical protein
VRGEKKKKEKGKKNLNHQQLMRASKNYRAPAIWSDHFRSTRAIRGNWILKTSFIVDQLLWFQVFKTGAWFPAGSGHLSEWAPDSGLGDCRVIYGGTLQLQRGHVVLQSFDTNWVSKNSIQFWQCLLGINVSSHMLKG